MKRAYRFSACRRLAVGLSDLPVCRIRTNQESSAPSSKIDREFFGCFWIIRAENKRLWQTLAPNGWPALLAATKAGCAVTAIAIRLILRLSATTEPGFRHAIDGLPRSGHDLEITGHVQGTVERGLDGQRPVTLRKGL
jgi:hypothetical protein